MLNTQDIAQLFQFKANQIVAAMDEVEYWTVTDSDSHPLILMDIAMSFCKGLCDMHLALDEIEGKPFMPVMDAEPNPAKQRHWITTEHGSHILVNGNGEVVAGAGGKLVGKKFSVPVGSKDVSKHIETTEKLAQAGFERHGGNKAEYLRMGRNKGSSSHFAREYEKDGTLPSDLQIQQDDKNWHNLNHADKTTILVDKLGMSKKEAEKMANYSLASPFRDKNTHLDDVLAENFKKAVTSNTPTREQSIGKRHESLSHDLPYLERKEERYSDFQSRLKSKESIDDEIAKKQALIERGFNPKDTVIRLKNEISILKELKKDTLRTHEAAPEDTAEQKLAVEKQKTINGLKNMIAEAKKNPQGYSLSGQPNSELLPKAEKRLAELTDIENKVQNNLTSEQKIQKTRLDILQNSLAKKEAELNHRFDSHFEFAASTNGQPLNDKGAKGQAALNKMDKQNSAIRNQKAEIEKTKAAIEKQQGKDSAKSYYMKDMPKIVQEMTSSGEIRQWSKFPDHFFVPGVDKGRIVVKDGKVFVKYLNQVPKEQYAKFRDAANKILKEVNNL